MKQQFEAGHALLATGAGTVEQRQPLSVTLHCQLRVAPSGPASALASPDGPVSAEPPPAPSLLPSTPPASASLPLSKLLASTLASWPASSRPPPALPLIPPALPLLPPRPPSPPLPPRPELPVLASTAATPDDGAPPFPPVELLPVSPCYSFPPHTSITKNNNDHHSLAHSRRRIRNIALTHRTEHGAVQVAHSAGVDATSDTSCLRSLDGGARGDAGVGPHGIGAMPSTAALTGSYCRPSSQKI